MARPRMYVAAGCVLAMIGLAPASAVASSAGAGSNGAGSDGAEVSRSAPAVPKTLSTRTAPPGPNPYLALVPNQQKVDFAAWRQWVQQQSAKRATVEARSRLAAAAQPLLVDEDEPADILGSNDSPATAQHIDGFGTAANRNNRARILGDLAPPVRVPTRVRPANPEDDGSIPLAGDTGITDEPDGITTSAVIGDGPHGSAAGDTGDFDFYRLEAQAGDSLTVDTQTPTGPLDSIAVLYDDAGEIVALNDDEDFPTNLDSLLRYEFTVSGTYYAMVTGYNVLPEDPFDSGSGEGAESEGPYGVRIALGDRDDRDFFAVRLRKGDVLGAAVEDAATTLAIWDTVPRDVHGSTQDATYLYPLASPLPGGGNAVTEYVAEQAGWHYVAASVGLGGYDLTVEAYRPGLEGNPPVQTVFLDFDGARVNTGIWGGPGVVTLSPLRAFLGRWGLAATDETALVNGIVAEVRENIRQDLIDSGLNGRFRVRILNSRVNPDPFGDPHVSRIIVGGTIAESGISTIGIAESIDPGNFEAEETALVLLDVLSNPSGAASLNTYLTPVSDKLAFVGQAVGNVVAHEAGHYLGNWHVDNENEVANLMNAGGTNFDVLFGVGPDGIGGTADDTDVDFGEDVFDPDEGFTGIEDTLARPVFGLTR